LAWIFNWNLSPYKGFPKTELGVWGKGVKCHTSQEKKEHPTGRGGVPIITQRVGGRTTPRGPTRTRGA